MPNIDPATLAALAAIGGGASPSGGTADASSIAALLGGGANGLLSSGTTGADLSNFQRTITANDPWNMALAPVVNTKLNTATWTPNQALAGNLGQAALAAVLRTLGNRSEADQLFSATQALPQLYKDPMGTPTPDGVDPEAFNALRFSAIGRQATTDDAIRRSLGERGIRLNADGTFDTSILDATDNIKNGEMRDARAAAVQARAEAAKQKQEDDLRRLWNNPTSQKEIAATVSLRDAAQQLMAINTPLSGLAQQELFNRIQNPGANAIRGSLLQKTQDAQSPYQKAAGAISNLLGGSSMSVEQTKQLAQVLDVVTKDRLNYYKNFADNNIYSIAQNRGLDAESILPKAEYDNLFGGLGNAPAGPPQPPPGYELTGKIDANGNYGIRKIQ